MRTRRGFVHRLLRSSSGASAAEFVLVLPVLILLISGIFDVAGLAYTNLQVSASARAGASYALSRPFDQANITSAMTNATRLSVATSVPAEPACGCPDAAAGIAPASCGATCSGGDLAGRYVTVSATADHDLIFGWPGLDNPTTLSSTATVRIP